MNREIKFRAWDKKKKLMVNDIHDYHDCEGCFSEYRGICDTKEYDDIEVFGDFLTSNRFDVSQFTGLKDKAGVDIYEGDILACKEYVRDGSGNFELRNYLIEYGEDARFTMSGSPMQKKYCSLSTEVIGNKWENPELMEG